MDLSEPHWALLVAELGGSRYAGKTEQEAFDLLHGPPVVETTKPKRLTIANVSQCLSLPSLESMVDYATLESIRQDILGQNRDGLLSWAAVMTATGKITSDEMLAMNALCEETEQISETDPNGVPRVCVAFAGVAGFPNSITPGDFAEVWTEVTNGAA